MDALKGPNEIERVRSIAAELRSYLVSYRKVMGIVYSGALVRGFADKYSDVDITVFLSENDEVLRKELNDKVEDIHKRVGTDIDFVVYVFSDFSRRKWNETDRWDFSNADIVYDPTGQMRKFINEKLRVKESFWLKRIVIAAQHLRWYCCPLKGEMGTMAETWISRGNLASAHNCVTYGLDTIFAIVFALNKEFLPPVKWRIFDSYRLKWQPERYCESIEEILTIRSLSESDFSRRVFALRALWQRILPKIIKETGLDAESMSKLYVDKIFHKT